MENKYDYALEKRLRELSPDLHQRFTDTVFSLQFILSNYKLIFPEYTIHVVYEITCRRYCGDEKTAVPLQRDSIEH